MGSGSSADVPRCEALGGWLARQRVHLLTGGGPGAMAAVSRGFFEVRKREGLVLGVLPAASATVHEAPSGYPNHWVELAIRTHLHARGHEGDAVASRNHINVLTADVIVALAGSAGTSSEARLAVQYGRPIAAYVQDRSEIPQLPETVPVVRTLKEIQAFVRAALP
jgi:uncharacterized protein (TIGR00725 family)